MIDQFPTMKGKIQQKPAPSSSLLWFSSYIYYLKEIITEDKYCLIFFRGLTKQKHQWSARGSALI